MSYWSYWKLTAAPFANAQNLFYRGQSVDEALARIEFLCSQRRNLATLVGPSGVGKSSLMNWLLQRPPRQTDLPSPQITQVSTLGMASGDLALELSRKICASSSHSVPEAWSLLSDCLLTRQRSNAHTLVLVDDVEHCGAATESDLIRLVRLAEDKNVSLLLSIESNLVSTVSRWLWDRSYLNIELAPWDLQQTREYIRFALARCQGAPTIFNDDAIARMVEHSKGIARRLAQLADLALVAGAVRGATRIDESIIHQVVQELPRPIQAAAA